MTHVCTLCNKSFHAKTTFDKHDAFCKFTHSAIVRKNPTHDQESIEKLTHNQLTKLVLGLACKVQHLERMVRNNTSDIQNLKTRQRISMSKWLTKTKSPSKKLLEWIKSIPVTQTHLEKVFNNDLLYGVVESIKEEIAAYKFQSKQMPIYAFTQKNKTVYVYDDPIKKTPSRLNDNTDPVWCVITTDHLKKMFSILHTKMEQQYKQWQDTHSSLLNNSEDWKEKEMIYTRKVMGMMDNETTRCSKLKQWLYTQIHLPFEEITLELEN